ncbi:MAG: hypothetical protein ACRC5H_10725 [Treponemataceae bacterium]
MGGLKRSIIFFASLFFVTACGLEEYYILEPPIFIRDSVPTDDSNNRYNFRTNESVNSSLGDVFVGTVVFYKIYNSESELNSARSSISSSNTDYSQAGYNRLKSLDYKELLIKNSTETVLLPKTDNNRAISIRLYQQGSASNPYEAGLFIDDEFQGYPVRYNRKEFIDTDNFGDDDTVNTAGSSLDEWYINAYAVTYGLDPFLSPVYSTVLYLGSIYVKNPDL